MNEFCQKLIRTAEASLGSAAAIIALVCTIDSIRGDQNPLINKMWITAAALPLENRGSLRVAGGYSKVC